MDPSAGLRPQRRLGLRCPFQGRSGQHKALGEFYDSWLDSVDSFIETYAGKYARPVGGFTGSVVPYQEGASLTYIKRVSSFMTSESVRSIAPDTDLQNILDELTAIANHTAYLLTLK